MSYNFTQSFIMEIMDLRSENVDVLNNFDLGFNRLDFIFKGKFTIQASVLATQSWRKKFESVPSQKFVLTWDCTNMDSFEIGARREWLNCMNDLHGQIEKIVVISDNMIIRGAAHLMLNSFKFKYEIRNT